MTRYETHSRIKQLRSQAETVAFYRTNYNVDSWENLMGMSFPVVGSAQPATAGVCVLVLVGMPCVPQLGCVYLYL